MTGSGDINLCLPLCDPLLQDCESGEGCYWNGRSFGCWFQGSNVPAGEPCGFINDCVPGNTCVSAESLSGCAGDACCTSFCNLQLTPECPMPLECLPWFEEGTAPPEYEHVGVCLMP